ncbi:hypothetical protein Mucpa_4898 [Mucilaginibacter paludis DSM 18603]|uniref:Uncharacterized protein n=1 Tax=Mucilaginibacter paludis DSM 18603 TaxID=714943 RepID=H1Y795_9SPHI|nr:hypothetical protein Mucpa_4898 [Mucilaginibacter paludis DSM 18603]
MTTLCQQCLKTCTNILSRSVSTGINLIRIESLNIKRFQDDGSSCYVNFVVLYIYLSLCIVARR